MAAKKKASKKKATSKKTSKKKVTKKAPSKVATGGKADDEDAPKKVVAQRSPAKKRLMNEWIASVNSPERTVAAMASDVKGITDVKRPTGIMPIDIDCGGGFSANRMSLISGPDNAGKSYLLIMTMIMHQRLYGADSAIGIVAVEPFDFKRALDLGFKVAVPDAVIAEWQAENVLAGRGEYSAEDIARFKEQIGEVVLMRGETGDEALEVALSAVKSGLFGIVGIDSVSIMLPAVDADKDVGDRSMMASNATLMTDFVKKYTPLMNALNEVRYTTVIGIQQVRANMDGNKYTKDWKVSGARALRHLKSIDIQVWSGTKLFKQIDKVKTLVGKETNWHIDKGKDGTHEGKTGTIPFYHAHYYVPGIDMLGSVMAEGLKYNVIQQQKSKVALVNPSTRETITSAPSQVQLRKMMEADFEFELHVRRLILDAAGIRCLYRQLD